MILVWSAGSQDVTSVLLLLSDLLLAVTDLYSKLLLVGAMGHGHASLINTGHYTSW